MEGTVGRASVRGQTRHGSCSSFPNTSSTRSALPVHDAQGVAPLVLGPIPARQFIDEFFSSRSRSDSPLVSSAFKKGMFERLVKACGKSNTNHQCEIMNPLVPELSIHNTSSHPISICSAFSPRGVLYTPLHRLQRPRQ